MDKHKPIVSVCCLVYNHEPYLRECFEGFIMQQTTFPIEILVHDDASTDHSADIICEYTAKYPDLFKPIYQTENQYSKGVDVFVLNVKRAKGKYIAVCEGDDYWTDPLKLQKQVEFLEANKDVGYVFTKHQILRLDRDNIYSDCERLANTPQITDLHYLFKNQILPQTLTICFKTSLCPMQFPEGLYSDLALLVVIAQNCKIGFINEYSGVYRMGVGICSRLKRINAARKYAKLHKAINKYTGGRYNYKFGRSARCRILYQAYRVERKYYPIAYIYYIVWQISEKGFNSKNIYTILKNTFRKFRKIKNLCH